MVRDAVVAVLSSRQREPAWPDDGDYELAASEFARIQALLPPGILLLASPVRDWLSHINPADRDYIRSAVPQRQAEFSTGRMLASRALAAIGAASRSINRGAVNEPVWPAGVVGSISHTRRTCMVAVAASNEFAGLGIDLEARREEFRDVEHMVLRPEERRGGQVDGLPDDDVIRVVFGAKEAIYKALYAHVGRIFDFQDIRVDFRLTGGRYTATAPDDPVLDGLVRKGAGRFVVMRELVFAIWY